nr:amidophosphoribosyltransferase [Bacteroidota bacterium]
AIALLKANGNEKLIDEVYKRCKESSGDLLAPNHVNEIYRQFTDVEISRKISEMLRGDHVKAEVDIIYQSVDDLHKACPDHKGDWYFTGNFPTPGGNRVANRSFVNFYEERNERAY